MESFEALRKYLASLSEVPQEEWIHFSSRLSVRTLGKGECYFRQGDTLFEIGFVAQGLLHSYYTDSMGERFVKYFIPERSMVAGYASLLQGIPARFTSQALEP